LGINFLYKIKNIKGEIYMELRFTKHVKLTKHIRLNVSKSGIGISGGIRGA